MTTRFLSIPLLLTGLFVLSFDAQAGPDGKLLYQEHCNTCHSRHGLGGIGLPLTTEKLKTFPDSYIRKTIRIGRPGRIMPAFNSLSDAQVTSIIEYMRQSEEAPEPANLSQISIKGNVLTGKKLYQQHCSECHGSDGNGLGLGTGVSQSRERDFEVIPPSISNTGFLQSASDSFIKHAILNSRADSEMPNFKKRGLTSSNVNDIISYVRSLEKTTNKKVSTAENNSQKPTLIIDSPYNFKTTAENLKQAIKGKNFRYFPDRLLEKGLTSDDKLNRKQLAIRYCNFSSLFKMLKVEPRLGVLLPCRITVIEDKNGKVKIVAMDLLQISKLFNNQQLEDLAGDLQDEQMEIIEEATL